MKKVLILVAVFTIGLLTSYGKSTKKSVQNQQKIVTTNNTILGKWVRIGHTGPTSFSFGENGLIEGDLGNDGVIDVVAQYELTGDTIKFIDKEGEMCRRVGQYKVDQTKYYLSFDLIDDDCGGRIKTTMGFWTRPDFQDLLKALTDEITQSQNPELYLSRARIFMATGANHRAKEDLDKYLLTDTLNARIYINRAGTRFPNDLKGVVSDCNKVISLEPNNKNAYFLRGLARYSLGEKEQGCEDFSKAIELGFSVLRIAEQEKCIEFWDKN